MIIKRIMIHAFGKFSDKAIVFDDGVTVITGLNEAGKSTIHKFIECMFYGFYKPYTKKKLYEADYELYIPWDHSGFSGTLVLIDGGRTIRLERQFAKNKDEFHIYDDITGEELTKTYGYNKVTKQAEFAHVHIGHNKVMYRNTISLTQMKSKTDHDLIREIKDNMSNLASTHQVTISVDKVLKRIEEKENNIGSTRKQTSHYYKLKSSISVDKKALIQAKEIHKRILKDKVEENKLRQQLEKSREKEAAIKQQLADLENQKDQERYKKIKRLINERSALESTAQELEAYKSFDIKIVEKLKKEAELTENLNRDYKKLVEKEKEAKEKEQKLLKKKSVNRDGRKVSQNYETVNKAVGNYEDIDDNLKIKQQEINHIKNQQSSLDIVEKTSGNRKLYLIAVAITILSIIGGHYNTTAYIMLFVPVLIIGYSRYKVKNEYELYTSYRLKDTNLLKQIGSLEGKIEVLELERIQILKTEEVSNYHGLKAKRDDLLSERALLEAGAKEQIEVDEQLNTVKQELERLTVIINLVHKEHKEQQESYMELLQSYNMVSQEEIQEGFKKYLAYESNIKDIKHLDIRIRDMLGDSTVEALEEHLLNRNEVHVIASQEELGKEQEKIQNDLLRLTKDISEVITRIEQLGLSSKSVAEIEEALYEKEVQIKGYDHELAVAKVIKTAIETIAVDIQNNFAPILNEKLSRMTHQISNGKYVDIKVNPEMALTIYDKEAQKTIKAESLSAGTLDMLYLGLRLSVSEVLNDGQHLPLILDDAFVQYDKKRLGQALELLHMSERQVILFTCHEREEEIMKERGYKYHLISI